MNRIPIITDMLCLLLVNMTKIKPYRLVMNIKIDAYKNIDASSELE